MTLVELAQRTTLPLRLLRYVLDHGLLPGGRIESRGRGTAREFMEMEAYGIACAAMMLQAGLRQSVVRDCLALLYRYADQKKTVTLIPLVRASRASQSARLEVGDGVNVRLLSTGTSPEHNQDTGWQQITTGAKLGTAYEPMIGVSVNLGQLSRRLG